MPVTTIDPAVALIVVDLQKGLAGIDTVHPFDGVVANSARLARAFRERGLPVVLVTATGGAPGRTDEGSRAMSGLPADFADVVDELGACDDDVRIVKQRWGAFTGTALDEQLRSRAVTQVIVTGVATSAGVESTARSAHEHGYHVVLATDAMTDRDADAHHHGVARVFPRIGETGSTAEILALLS